MTQVTITRHYSGFTNISDKFSVGNHECDGNASVGDYLLPEGYEVESGDFSGSIFDPAGYLCEIVPHSSGLPQLVSLYGKIQTSPVLTKIESAQ